MSNSNAIAGCLLVGEYVDEAEIPTDFTFHKGEVVRPKVVADHLDIWEKDDGLREFTVLLKDGRVIAVRGHLLEHSPHLVAEQDIYRIVIRTPGEAVLVALFKTAEVAGIFHGEIRSDRKIA